MGVSRRCVKRWLDRYATEGDAGLQDRSSRPHRSPRRTAPSIEAMVLAFRNTERVGRDEIADRTGVPARTISRILADTGPRTCPEWTQSPDNSSAHRKPPPCGMNDPHPAS